MENLDCECVTETESYSIQNDVSNLYTFNSRILQCSTYLEDFKHKSWNQIRLTFRKFQLYHQISLV